VPLGDVTGARVVRLRLPGTLTLHGVARPIEFPVEARWDGATIQVAGGTRVRRADFGLEVPNLVGYRIEDTGVVELELTLVRKGAALAGPAHGEPCRGGRRPAAATRRRPAAVHRHHRPRRGAPVHHRRRRARPAPGRRRHRRRARPTWSPDGRLSFVRDGNLHIIRPDGSGSACVRTGMLLTSGARWRPSSP
jgi:hypothetical protein